MARSGRCFLCYFKYAMERLKWAVETARRENFKIVKDAEIILVLAVEVKSEDKDLKEYFNEAKGNLKEMEGVNELFTIPKNPPLYNPW